MFSKWNGDLTVTTICACSIIRTDIGMQRIYILTLRLQEGMEMIAGFMKLVTMSFVHLYQVVDTVFHVKKDDLLCVKQVQRQMQLVK